jgi:hypothetical protein
MPSIIRTHHTYPILVGRGSRLARCDWERLSASQAVTATLAMDPEAIILRLSDGAALELTGHAPGGIGAL